MKSRTVAPSVVVALAVATGAWFAVVSSATDVGVVGTTVSLGTNTVTGKHTLKSVQKDVNVHLGATATPAQLSGQLEVFYVDTPTNLGTLGLPAPWATASPTTAKYKNALAPGGPTVVKSATVKNGKLVKVSGKGLGGLNIATAPGPGGVVTKFTIANAADSSSHSFCSLYAVGSGSQVSHITTASGFKLKLKRGVAHVCATCTDGDQNGDETDIDCGGGTCGPCPNGNDCAVGSDCVSGVCIADVCQAPTCADATTNGTESDTDCGGGTCPPCGDGSACGAFTDCTSLICTSGVCEPASCSDGIENGTESDVDCGGVCSDCPDGDGCNGPTDCQSGVCTAGFCQAPTCADGVSNGSETGTDCGGGACPACPAGQGCDAPSDCQSSVCTGNVCQAPTCADGVQNGTESDVDCGGSCADCPNGDTCNTAGDCQSGVCTGSVCQVPTCADGVENGSETDIDCGGSCPDCGTGAGCNSGADCVSGVCVGMLCQAATCSDGVKNGSETDIDCGGGTCPDCAINKMCLGASDCLSNFCTGGLCKCPGQTFTFNINSNDGGSVDSAEWPGGTALQNGPAGCSITINRPSDNIDLVGNLGNKFSVNGFSGYSGCGGTGGEDGDGCQPVSCPPAGIGSCEATRPSCSAALNGTGSARYFVQCNQ